MVHPSAVFDASRVLVVRNRMACKSAINDLPPSHRHCIVPVPFKIIIKYACKEWTHGISKGFKNPVGLKLQVITCFQKIISINPRRIPSPCEPALSDRHSVPDDWWSSCCQRPIRSGRQSVGPAHPANQSRSIARHTQNLPRLLEAALWWHQSIPDAVRLLPGDILRPEVCRRLWDRDFFHHFWVWWLKLIYYFIEEKICNKVCTLAIFQYIMVISKMS